MSLFRISRADLLNSLSPASRVTATRFSAGFHQSAIRDSLSENDRNRETQEDMAKNIESNNQDQLRKHKEGRPHWKESLASSSEADVKADRGEEQDTEEVATMERAMKAAKGDKKSAGDPALKK